MAAQAFEPVKRINALSVPARRVLFYALLGLGAFSFVLPFLFMISTAFKPPREVYGLNLIPHAPTTANFTAVFKQIPIGQAIFNSVLTYGTITISVLLFSSIVGYALSRLEFRGREFIFNVILLTMMIPGQLLLIPLYLLIVRFHLTDNLLGLILPGMMSAFGIFMFRQTFKTVPQDLIDAARIDGAGEFTILTRVLWPLSLPTIITVGIFTFMGGWNDFLWPAIVIREQHLMTLTQLVTVYAIGGQAGGQFGSVMASSLLGVLPMVLVFIVFQRYYLQGIVSTGIKG
jgi:multiple sugar transport system permease protein